MDIKKKMLNQSFIDSTLVSDSKRVFKAGACAYDQQEEINPNNLRKKWLYFGLNNNLPRADAVQLLLPKYAVHFSPKRNQISYKHNTDMSIHFPYHSTQTPRFHGHRPSRNVIIIIRALLCFRRFWVSNRSCTSS